MIIYVFGFVKETIVLGWVQREIKYWVYKLGLGWVQREIKDWVYKRWKLGLQDWVVLGLEEKDDRFTRRDGRLNEAG